MGFRGTDIALSKEEVINKSLSNPFRFLYEEGYRPSLFEFLKMCWSEVSEDPYKDNWHVEYLCKELEKIAWRVARHQPKENDLIINIPPGTTKTIICSIMFPAWCWAMGWYWMCFITASYSAQLALESAEKSRDLIRSDKFHTLFPELSIKEDKDTKSNFRIVKIIQGRPRQGGNRFSTSVGGSLTGFHGHILIVDDPLNPEQAASEKELLNCNRWMEQTLPTRKKDKDVAATILVMQRLHQNDPTGRAQERKKSKLKHICLPGQIRDYGEFVTPPEAAENYIDGLLDPVRLGTNALHELLEDLGQYGFAGQIGQNPAPPGGGMFKVEMMPFVDRVFRPNVIQTIRYWDKAGSEEADSAYTAGVKMTLLKGKKFVIEDVVRGRWAAEVRERIIRKTAEADGTNVSVYIEQEPGSGGKESVHASISNLAGFSARKDLPTGDKIRRADPFSVQVNEGNVLLLRGEWNRSFKDELSIFPYGTYKDQVDAGSAAFNILAKKKFVRVLR